MILGVGLTFLFVIIFRDLFKASLILVCWLVIFFSYGPVYNVIWVITAMGYESPLAKGIRGG
jgi:hypothetical protein